MKSSRRQDNLVMFFGQNVIVNLVIIGNYIVIGNCFFFYLQYRKYLFLFSLPYIIAQNIVQLFFQEEILDLSVLFTYQYINWY